MTEPEEPAGDPPRGGPAGAARSLTALAGIVGAVVTVVGPLVTTQRAATAIAIAIVALVIGGGYVGARLRRMRLRPMRWRSVLYGLVFILIGGFAGVAVGYVPGRYVSERNDAAIAINEPADGAHYVNAPVTITVRLTVHDTAGLCGGQIWLMDREPSGKAMPDGTLQPLYRALARFECREGRGSTTFSISPWPWHELAVYWIPATASDWGARNEIATEGEDSTHDGDWVRMPAGSQVESNVVRMTLQTP